MRSILGANGLVQRQTPNPSNRPSGPLEKDLVEGWSEGYLVGSLIILILITCANMKSGVLLHKLILTELVLCLGQGTFILIPDPTYSWYVSSTAALLYLSYTLHNVIAWIKIKPFLSRWVSLFYIGTIILVFPYWIAEIYFNFACFNLESRSFQRTRPWEALARDPWWLFTSIYLIIIIRRDYNLGIFELLHASPRFGVLILCICTSFAFVLVDIAVTAAGGLSSVNPYWKLALVFKCTSDALFLDDFKKVLDQLTIKAFGRFNYMSAGGTHGFYDSSTNPSTTRDKRLSDFGLQPIETTSSNASAPRSSWRMSLHHRRTRESDASQLSPSRSMNPFRFSKPRAHSDPAVFHPIQRQTSPPQKPQVAHIDRPTKRRATEWFDVIDESDIDVDNSESVVTDHIRRYG